MNKKPKESTIKDKIMEYLESLPECWSLKYFGGDIYTRKGVPDILCCIKGRFVALEVKRPGEKPTALQAHTLEQIRRAGGIAEVVHSLEAAKWVISSKSEG